VAVSPVRPPLAHRVPDVWLFDFDDVSPKVGKHLPAKRAGQQLSHLNDPQVSEWPLSF
jgi:hypothetical protein